MTEAQKTNDRVDVLIVGGGINGAAIARDAAGRGLSVLLCEQHDLAAHTSSASSKLIHGGLRYLAQYEFGLVRKSLTEREVVLRAAPHIVRPRSFVLPHDRHLRPAWMIRAALLLYDHLGKRGVRERVRSRRVDLREDPAGMPLQAQFHTGFIYSDACCDDARLVVLNALDAAARGAQVCTRTRCMRAQRDDAGWQVQLRHALGDERRVFARALVNASGPWAASFLDEIARQPPRRALRLVKGSHIVVPRLYAHEHAYTLQQEDGRIVFAIPFEHDYTLIGTTDVEFAGSAQNVSIDAAEVQYLCAASNRYFNRAIAPTDVVWSYSGVRALLADDSGQASQVTRDYLLDCDSVGAPLVSVFGGKITTHRKLAEEAVDWLAPVLGNTKRAWTADGAKLPGGDFGHDDGAAFDRYLQQVKVRLPWLPASLALRYVSSYGTRSERVLDGATALHDLGEHFGADLYEREVAYLVAEEWARDVADILWRRTKLGLRIDAAGHVRLQRYLENTRASW